MNSENKMFINFTKKKKKQMLVYHRTTIMVSVICSTVDRWKKHIKSRWLQSKYVKQSDKAIVKLNWRNIRKSLIKIKIINKCTNVISFDNHIVNILGKTVIDKWHNIWTTSTRSQKTTAFYQLTNTNKFWFKS